MSCPARDRPSTPFRGVGRVGALAVAIACSLVGLVFQVAASAAAPTARRGADRIVVQAPRARAVVERSPFRISFSEAGGGPVLREVPNRLPGSLNTPPTADPIAPGFDNPSTPTLYSPLSFLVGTETLEQYDGSLFGGNLMSGERSGVQYAAKRVLSAERAGRGVRLTLSTTDPSGRTLTVNLAPLGCCAISVRASAPSRRRGGDDRRLLRLRAGRGVLRVRRPPPRARPARQGLLQLHQRGEHQRHHRLGSGRGRHLALPERPAGRLLPAGRVRLLARATGSSSTSRSWGASSSPPTARTAGTSPPRRSGCATSSRPASARRAIDTLTSLSGRQPLPPRWALGPMMDRLVKNFGETEADYEANLRADMRDLRRYRIPIRAYRIEGWGFPGGNHGLAIHTFTSPAASGRGDQHPAPPPHPPARLPAPLGRAGLGCGAKRAGSRPTPTAPPT